MDTKEPERMAPVYDNELTTCNLTKKRGGLAFYESEVLHLFELIPQCGNVVILLPLRIYVKSIENCHFTIPGTFETLTFAKIDFTEKKSQ